MWATEFDIFRRLIHVHYVDFFASVKWMFFLILVLFLVINLLSAYNYHNMKCTQYSNLLVKGDLFSKLILF